VLGGVCVEQTPEQQLINAVGAGSVERPPKWALAAGAPVFEAHASQYG
jgi:hypothetical protein